MALSNPNLLNLLLAYSASHRARFLKHPEPRNRIALWVRDVFPHLRHVLESPESQISNADLATAIMLASLEIIAPNTFEVPVSWQNHLDTARHMIIARGGAKFVNDHKDRVSYFLTRWFAYLDVLGSLSGTKNREPLESLYLNIAHFDDENGFEIDCLLGFTSRCIGILAKIADLAHKCDVERIGPTGVAREDWKPTAEMVEAAERLQMDLEESRRRTYNGCPHRSRREADRDAGVEEAETREIKATNEAFHWAGLIHLYKRILGRASTDAEVQRAVSEILSTLRDIRPGGTAEACLLFPIFTAGCEAQEERQRRIIEERLHAAEEVGMTQVGKARKLIELVWQTRKPWETLVTGEFFG